MQDSATPFTTVSLVRPINQRVGTDLNSASSWPLDERSTTGGDLSTPGGDSDDRYPFISRLRDALHEQPYEEGFSHPADALVAELLRRSETSVVATRLHHLFTNDYDDPAVTIGVMGVVGSLPPYARGEWAYVIAMNGLQHPLVSVREAAVTLLEELNGAMSVELLREHHEPIRWLADHIARVLALSST